MYENLSIQEYVKRMQAWDDEKNNKVSDFIEKNYSVVKEQQYEDGTTIIFKVLNPDAIEVIFNGQQEN